MGCPPAAPCSTRTSCWDGLEMVACAAAFVSLWMATVAACHLSVECGYKGHHHRLLEVAGPQVVCKDLLQTPCQNNYFGGSHVATDRTQLQWVIFVMWNLF